MINSGDRALAGDTITVGFQAYDTSSPPVELTGATDLQFAAYRRSDGLWYDFSDDTFKSKGSVTTLHKALTEKDATDAPGIYEASWDLSAATNHASTPDTFVCVLSETTGTDLGFVPAGEIQINPRELIEAAYEGAIWIDTDSGTAGSTLGIHGTRETPTTTWANAVTLANALGVKTFRVFSQATTSLTISTSFQNARIEAYGGGSAPSVIVGSSANLSYSEIHGCELANCNFTASTLVRLSECLVGACSMIRHNRLWRCTIMGTQTMATIDGSRFEAVDSRFLDLTDANPVYVAGGGSYYYYVQISGCSGTVGVQSMVHASTDIVLGLTDGTITLDSSNTAGSIDLHGLAELTDNSGASFSVDTGALQQPGTGGLTAQQVEDAVLDAAVEDHKTSGSIGRQLLLIRGVLFGNYTYRVLTRDSASALPLTYEVKVYDGSGQVPATSSDSEGTLLGTFSVTAEADGSFPRETSFMRSVLSGA